MFTPGKLSLATEPAPTRRASCLWIAVVYDLLAKVRELALGGDAEAQNLTNEVAVLQPKIASGDQGAIRRILQIEHDIVDITDSKFAFFEGPRFSI
jgi:hypothetical protein